MMPRVNGSLPAMTSVDLEFRSVAQFSLEEVAAVATLGFEGYFVPVHLDAAALVHMVRVDSVDLSASVVACQGGKPVAVGLVARRGWDSRLAGMCVAAVHRGQGIGAKLTRHLLAAARERGDRRFTLECIERNLPAVRLYQTSGFQQIRRLFGYSAERIEGTADPALEEIDPAEVSTDVARWGVADLPWQIAPQTLAVLNPPHRAFRLGPATALISDPAAATIVVRSLVVAPGARRRGHGSRMLKALAGIFPEKSWRFAAVIPEEIPPEFFGTLGFTRGSLTQLQMAQAL